MKFLRIIIFIILAFFLNEKNLFAFSIQSNSISYSVAETRTISPHGKEIGKFKSIIKIEVSKKKNRVLTTVLQITDVPFILLTPTFTEAKPTMVKDLFLTKGSFGGSSFIGTLKCLRPGSECKKAESHAILANWWTLDSFIVQKEQKSHETRTELREANGDLVYTYLVNDQPASAEQYEQVEKRLELLHKSNEVLPKNFRPFVDFLREPNPY